MSIPSREDAPQIYVPTLHRELVGMALPVTVKFLDPGLPATGENGLFTPPALPMPRDRAQEALRDLLALGESLDLTTRTGKQTARERLDEAVVSEAERADLARFSGRDAASGGSDEALVAAHKVLLLAWDLEERLIEIKRLRREVAEAVKPLTQNLHGDEADSIPWQLLDPAAFPEPEEADWKLTLAAMAAFIPAGTLLVTDHPAMRETLRSAGMLLPLPEDVAASLQAWDETSLSSMLWAKAPYWRVLGHAREPERAPWLLQAPDILVRMDRG